MHLKSAFYFIWFQIEKLMTTWLIIKLDISCNPIVDSFQSKITIFANYKV